MKTNKRYIARMLMLVMLFMPLTSTVTKAAAKDTKATTSCELTCKTTFDEMIGEAQATLASCVTAAGMNVTANELCMVQFMLDSAGIEAVYAVCWWFSSEEPMPIEVDASEPKSKL